MKSPTQQTLKYLRDRGWLCRIVEKWNPHARKRVDLWGADIIAIKSGVGYPLLVQCTSAGHGNIEQRQAKIEEIPAAKIWLESSAFMVQAWRKDGTAITRFAYYEDGELSWHEQS